MIVQIIMRKLILFVKFVTYISNLYKWKYINPFEILFWVYIYMIYCRSSQNVFITLPMYSSNFYAFVQ